MRDEREDFGEIRLGHGYRLVRRDARNWEMQHWHIPDQDSRLTRHDDGCWYQTENYFQQLDAAVLWAYERVLREERPNRAQDLRDALDEARAIAAGLKAAAEEAQAALG